MHFGEYHWSYHELQQRPVSSWSKHGYVCIHLPCKRDWNGFNSIFSIVHSLLGLMAQTSLCMTLTSVYPRTLSLDPDCTHCIHQLSARSLDALRCLITFMPTIPSSTLLSRRHPSVTWVSKTNLINCLRDIDAWMLLNKLKLNRDKSEVLVISLIYHPHPTLSSVDIWNETVLFSTSAHNICVIVDQSLSMKPHVNIACKSSFYHLRNIGFIRKYLTPDSAKIIIQALIVFKLDYCNSLLYGLPSYLIQKLQHIQNSAARLITQSPWFCHITPVLRDLPWLPVHLCIEFKVLFITYKVLQGHALTYIQELLQPYQPSHNLRSSSKHLLVKPHFNLNSYGKRAFSVAAPDLCNLLPEDMKSDCTVDIFKCKLRTLLFIQAFNL